MGSFGTDSRRCRGLRALPGSLLRHGENAWLRGAYRLGRGDGITATGLAKVPRAGAVGLVATVGLSLRGDLPYRSVVRGRAQGTHPWSCAPSSCAHIDRHLREPFTTTDRDTDHHAANSAGGAGRTDAGTQPADPLHRCSRTTGRTTAPGSAPSGAATPLAAEFHPVGEQAGCRDGCRHQRRGRQLQAARLRRLGKRTCVVDDEDHADHHRLGRRKPADRTPRSRVRLREQLREVDHGT